MSAALIGHLRPGQYMSRSFAKHPGKTLSDIQSSYLQLMILECGLEPRWQEAVEGKPRCQRVFHVARHAFR